MKCSKKYCTRKGAKRSGLCPRHRVEKWRKENPVRYAYTTLVDNAKRRGKPCTITFDYFVKFCIATDYMQGKGKTKESYTIDCIDPELGYVPGNIQRMSNIDNVRKHLQYQMGERGPYNFHVVTFKYTPDPSVPF